jgi:3-methyladenine DNA glycosylase AlkC
MSSLLKDIYSKDFYNNFSDIVGEVVPAFNKKKFIHCIFDDKWESKELKERMKHTAFVLSQFLPDDFEKAAPFIERAIMELRKNKIKETSLAYMFFPDYIETFGIKHFDTAVKALEFVTQFTSCEFAVRPFIIRYGSKMMKQMQQWSSHESHHVRRLASEGCRPRLPWAIALPTLKKDPSPILPILENLKTDGSEYVRRSVANNLNDIAKDNPQTVITIARKWEGIGTETDAIIKHGCRTLLKQGHADMLKYFGLENTSEIEVANFKVGTPKVKIGGDLVFSFSLHNISTEPKRIRLEYGVYYLRQNGKHSKKVFKICERQLQANERSDIQRKQSFKLITTRKFYAGPHKLSLIINGQERETSGFELTV